MSSDLKRIVRENALQLVQKASGPLRPRESGVTRLVALGIPNGTAQRVLDETSDLRLDTVEQLASALKVSPAQLLAPAADSPQILFRDLNPFEVMLLNLFRDLPDEDERHAAIVELNQRRDRARAAQVGDAGNPFAGAENRRQKALGHAPERRTGDGLVDNPFSSPTAAPRRGRKS